MKRLTMLGAPLLLFSAMAFAEESMDAPKSAPGRAEIDLRYANSEAEIKDGNSEDKIKIRSGDGFEVRGAAMMSPNIFLRGRYEETWDDHIRFQGQTIDLDTSLSIWRIGGGYQGPVGSILMYGALEFAQTRMHVEGEGSDSDSGGAASWGIKDAGTGSFLWNVEITWLFLDDTHGASLDATLGWRVTPALALTFGIEGYGFEQRDDHDNELGVGVSTLGIRYRF